MYLQNNRQKALPKRLLIGNAPVSFSIVDNYILGQILSYKKLNRLFQSDHFLSQPKLENIGEIPSETISIIANLPRLTNLAITNKGAANFFCNTSLVFLKLNGNKISDEIFGCISYRTTCIEYLDLSDTSVTDRYQFV